MSTPVTYEDLMDQNLSAKERRDKVWNRLRDLTSTSASTTATTESFGSSSEESRSLRQWPAYEKVVTHVAAADYNHTLTCPFDLLRHSHNNSNSQGKCLCPHGAVCCVRMELFDLPESLAGTGYTGLLTPGTTLEHCLLRLSSAMKPPNEALKSSWARAVLYTTGEKLRNAKLFPCAALKVFRENGRSSGNLLFGGSKIGQREDDYFSHCQSTCMTERMPRAVKPFVRKFWKYSDYPLSLGISEFCSYDVGGEETPPESLQFPFAVILKPCLQLGSSTTQAASTTSTLDAESAFDNFLDKVLAVPPDTVLFELYACPDPHDVPDPSKLQRIGRLITSSTMIPSVPTDGLFFKHQKKEDDYNLRPTWREALHMQTSVDGGKVKGTVGQLAGWKVFEEHIAEGIYVDFEAKT